MIYGARTEEAVQRLQDHQSRAPRAHTAAQREVLKLSKEFVDNRIMPEGSDSIDSFAEIYETVRCALHGQIVCTCCKLLAASA